MALVLFPVFVLNNNYLYLMEFKVVPYITLIGIDYFVLIQIFDFLNTYVLLIKVYFNNYLINDFLTVFFWHFFQSITYQKGLYNEFVFKIYFIIVLILLFIFFNIEIYMVYFYIIFLNVLLLVVFIDLFK